MGTYVGTYGGKRNYLTFGMPYVIMKQIGEDFIAFFGSRSSIMGDLI